MLEAERDQLDRFKGAKGDRYYFLDVESRELREQAKRPGSEIADLIEQDLAG